MRSADWGRVKQVFQAALDLPPQERHAYLREACGGDAQLLAEIESLLATHARAGGFADCPAVELLNVLDVDSRSAAIGRVLRAGDRLGAYEIQSLVGAGGMGEV